MISVNDEFYIMGRVLKAEGTAKDVRLWFSVMVNENPGARGRIIKMGDNKARAILEIAVGSY